MQSPLFAVEAVVERHKAFGKRFVIVSCRLAAIGAADATAWAQLEREEWNLLCVGESVDLIFEGNAVAATAPRLGVAAPSGVAEGEGREEAESRGAALSLPRLVLAGLKTGARGDDRPRVVACECVRRERGRNKRGVAVLHATVLTSASVREGGGGGGGGEDDDATAHAAPKQERHRVFAAWLVGAFGLRALRGGEGDGSSTGVLEVAAESEVGVTIASEPN